MPNIDINIPQLGGMDFSDEKAVRKLTSYLYKLDEQLRYVLSNLSEDNLSDSLRAVINAGVDATVLNELTGRLQRLNTQIVQTAEQIALKASREELDALGDVLSASVAEFEVTAEQIRSEVGEAASGLQSQINQQADEISLKASKEEVAVVSQAAAGAADAANSAAAAASNAQNTANNTQAGVAALEQRVSKNEAEISVQADEIALRVTKTQHEADIAGKLDADAPSIGVVTASAVVNEKGVYLTGGEIDMRTSSGEDYVNITDRGVEASSLSAPNIMPRYAGPTQIYVNPSATSEEIEAGNTFRSLQEALDTLNGRIIPASVTVYIRAGTLYETARMTGVTVLGWLSVRAYDAADKPVLVGGVALAGCTGRMTISNIEIQGNGYYGLDISGCGPRVNIESCSVTGGQYSCIIASDGSDVSVIGSEMYDSSSSVFASTGSKVYMENNRGNCKVTCQKSIIQACGTVPSGSASYFDYSESWAGKVFTENVTVDQGGAAPAVPTISAMTSYASETTSYEADGGVWNEDSVVQGWWNGGGRIRGCMWFDNTTIRASLTGKSVLSATLRLTMNTSGRGTAVTVELAGTSANAGGSPAVTKTYGVIATMSPKETATITIPTQAIADLVSGTINGLMLYSSDTGSYKEREYSKNYAAFTGADGDSSTKPMLMVTYEG